MTARLHQSVSWGWIFGGSQARSEEGGLWEAESSGLGGEDGTLVGGGTAGGGGDGGCELFA